MHAVSRHGTHSITSLPKDDWMIRVFALEASPQTRHQHNSYESGSKLSNNFWKLNRIVAREVDCLVTVEGVWLRWKYIYVCLYKYRFTYR